MNHGQWLCYLSKNNIRKIVIRNSYRCMKINSFIFWCNELEHLELDFFTLSPPPTGFSGYRNLKHLELVNIIFSEENVFCSLFANCTMLASLRLEDWRGMSHMVIDVPSLKTLILKGYLEGLAFRNVCNLESVSMSLDSGLMTDDIKDVVNILANSCKIQFIDFGGDMSEFLVAGGIKKPPVAFNYLNELCLSDLNFSEFGVSRYVLDMVDCCPNIKKLNIIVVEGGNLEQHELDYNYSIKLNHLLEVKIEGITGSSAELKLIEYLLAISVVLEKLFFTFEYLHRKSEVKLYRELMGFPRASTKARLICLEK
ncbi:hypothetical protein RND81_11G053400 [Saponaria officinalis]